MDVILHYAGHTLKLRRNEVCVVSALPSNRMKVNSFKRLVATRKVAHIDPVWSANCRSMVVLHFCPSEQLLIMSN